MTAGGDESAIRCPSSPLPRGVRCGTACGPSMCCLVTHSCGLRPASLSKKAPHKAEVGTQHVCVLCGYYETNVAAGSRTTKVNSRVKRGGRPSTKCSTCGVYLCKRVKRKAGWKVSCWNMFHERHHIQHRTAPSASLPAAADTPPVSGGGGVGCGGGGTAASASSDSNRAISSGRASVASGGSGSIEGRFGSAGTDVSGPAAASLTSSPGRDRCEQHKRGSDCSGLADTPLGGAVRATPRQDKRDHAAAAAGTPRRVRRRLLQ